MTLAADGSFTYRPNAGFFGTDTFRYLANDGFEDSPPATVTITVRPGAADFGDAPLPYPTLLAENGAGTWRSARRWAPTATRKPTASHSARGRRRRQPDDDGVTFGTIRAGQLGATATVNVQNAPVGASSMPGSISTATAPGAGRGNRSPTAWRSSSGDNTITFDVPSWAADGTTYARFRLSTAGNLGVGGAAADGEVEDYAVTILPPKAACGCFGGQNTISTAADGA